MRIAPGEEEETICDPAKALHRKKMAPSPSEAVWTQQGPIFRGQKWQMALDGG